MNRDRAGATVWSYSLEHPDSQVTYCLMKGFEFSRIEEIDTDGDGQSDDDWFNQQPPADPPQDFASALVATQHADGYWSDCYWDYDEDWYLCATWALLTLERVAPESPIPPEPEVPAAPPPFVPEASTLILLGSAASGLAGYVGLQIRARRRK